MTSHGDPLLAATGMKDVEDQPKTAPHATVGHGDPLLNEVEHHEKLALHSEFSGQGDPVMDASIKLMDDAAKDGIVGTGHVVNHQRHAAGEKHIGPRQWNLKKVEKPPVSKPQ